MSAKPAKEQSDSVAADAKNPRALAKQLNEQTKKFFDLSRRGNFKEIARLTTEDFSFIDDRGVMAAAASCVENLESMVSNPDPTATLLKIKDFTVDDVQTRVYGDTAIETLRYSDNVTVRNKAQGRSESLSRTFRVTNVWVKQGEGWQLASTQLTPVQL